MECNESSYNYTGPGYHFYFLEANKKRYYVFRYKRIDMLTDAVILCTQNNIHLKSSIRAIDRGYHYMLELKVIYMDELLKR